jgi:HEAT repeat protein
VIDREAIRKKAEETLAIFRGRGPLAGQIRLQRALYGTGDEPGTQVLMKAALENGTVYDRETVLLALFETRERGEAGDAMVTLLLADHSYFIRERTIYHLSLEGETRWLPSIKKALGDEDYYVRATAARALGRMGEQSAVPALLALSSKEVGWSRLCVLQALVMLRHEPTIKTMKELAQGSPSSKERAYVLGMLYEAGDASQLSRLMSMVGTPDDTAREIACRYLVRSAPPGEIAVFIAVIAQGDFHAFRHALERLRKFPAESRSAILSEAFNLSSDRRKGLLSLFGKEEPDPLKVYLCACQLRGDDILALLVEHLYAVNRDRARKVTRELLQDEGMKRMAPYPESLISAMAAHGDDVEITSLSGFLEDDSDELKRSAAVTILGILARIEIPVPGK